MKDRKKWLKRGILALFCLGITGGLAVFGLSSFVKNRTADKIVNETEAAKLDADCILVLGCGVREDGTPSLMLRDRLETGVALYEAGAAPKLLMSGDHGRKDYDEVNLMKDYAMEKGIPSEDIFMDHAGFSTYDSMVRARDIFCAKTVVIVSQEYHLYRALYLAEKLGLEAYGVPALDVNYRGQAYREFREMLARSKDFCTAVIQPQPKFLGEKIPISGNGDMTND
ncbi:MAG: YdcF family protein [Anaerotignum sp.]|nr:YdcF family protein [Anaerotignum sp.]